MSLGTLTKVTIAHYECYLLVCFYYIERGFETLTMIADIFEAVGEAITAFATCVASGVSSVVNMFYVPTGENAGLTVLGTLLLIAVGAGLVFWAFRLIKGLIKRA